MIVNSRKGPADRIGATDWMLYIQHEKALTQAALTKSRDKLVTETRELFAPLPKAKNRWEALLVTLQHGISVYEGITTGLALMRGFRRLFGRK